MDNLVDRFNNRITQAMEKDAIGGESSKYNELYNASKEKIASLTQYRTQLLANKLANADSWVTRSGLNKDGVPASLVNIAANIYDGASTTVAGAIASLPDAMASAAAESGMSAEDTDAFNRYQRGEATAEDQLRLSQPKLHATQVDTPEALAETQANLAVNPQPSKLQLFEKAIQHRMKQRDILKSLNVNEIVQKDVGNKFNEDLGKDFQPVWDQVKQGASELFQQGNVSGSVDLVSGIGKLIYNAGEATLNNKEAALGYVANNIPQLAVGALGKVGMVGMTASNVGYAADNYQQGIVAYQKDHGGDLPPPDIRNMMALKSASLALAEHVGDVTQLGIAGAFGNGAKDVTRLGFKESLKNVVKAGGQGVLSEAPTEGFQTYMEGDITSKPTSAKDVYVGTVIGGVVGGGMTGGGRAIAEGVGATPQHAEKREQDRQVVLDEKKLVETGDVATLLDPKHPAFNPPKAVGVLYANSQREDTTPEVKTANLQKANEIVSGLEEKRSDLQLELDSYDTNQLQTKINTYKDHLAKATDPGLQERLTQAIADTETDLADTKTDATEYAKRIKVLGTQLGLMDQQIGSARKVLDQFAGLVQPKEDDIKTAVEAANTIPDAQDTNAVESSKKAVERVLTLAMAHPDSFSTEHLNQLANNTKNGLAEPQRQFLRAITKARIAENALKTTSQVSKEILEGDPSKNQWGIVDYQKKIGEALLGGNQKRADRFLGMLSSFATNHAAKQKLITTLYNKARKQRTSFDVVPLEGGLWEQTTEKRSLEELRDIGGLRIAVDSPKLVRALNVEVDALVQTKNALSAAYDLKFNPVTAVPSTTPNPTVVQEQTPSQKKMPASGWPTVSWGGMTVYPHVFEGMKSGEFKSIPLEHNKDMYEFSHITPKGERVAGTYWLEGNEINDFNITSEHGAHSLNTGVLRTVLGKIVKQHPNVTDLTGERISGVRKQAQQRDVSVHFKIKNGKLVQFPTVNSVSQGTSGTSVPSTVDSGQLQSKVDSTVDTVKEPVNSAAELANRDAWRAAGLARIEKERADRKAMSGSPDKPLVEDTKEAQAAPVTPVKRTPKAVAAAIRAEADSLGIPQGKLSRVKAKIAKHKAEIAALNEADKERFDELLAEVEQTITDDNELKEEINAITSSIHTETQGSDQGQSSEDGQGTDEDGSNNDPVAEIEGTSETNGAYSGRLSLFNKVSDYVGGQLGSIVDAAKGTQLYQKLNLIREMLTQDSKDNTQRPLVMEANFLESWNPEKYLGATPNEKQQALLDDFKVKVIDWLPRIKNNLVKGGWVRKLNKIEDDPDFYFKDLVQYLVQLDSEKRPKADMDMNAKLAIAQAAYGHIIENAGGKLLNTEDDVKSMFGVKEHEDLQDTGELYELLVEGWVTEKAVINSLGARVVQALGLKENPKATEDLLPKLQATLGAHVMKLLQDKKILERMEVHTSIIRDAMPERLAMHTSVGANTRQGFLRFTRNEGETFRERTLKDSTQSIVTLSKETSGVFTKLFGVESSAVEPSWEPITSHQKTTKNTRMGVPSFLKKILNWEDSVPNLLRQDVWHLMNLMDRENYAIMSGAIDFDPETTHDKNQTAYTAINEAIFREYDNGVDYFRKVDSDAPKGLLQEIFFPHVAWKPQRAGIGSTVLNPQSSKLHRGMLYRPEWETEVSLNDSGQMENFSLRVAEGLGIKTDKQDNSKALNALTAMLDENSEDAATRVKAKKLRAAIEAFKFVMTATDTLPTEIQHAIVEGVLAGGEKQHSRDSLMAIAEFEEAQRTNKPSFTIRLMTEVDGVANGPILSHLAMGAANAINNDSAATVLGNLLNKGGFFRKGDGHKNYNTYRGQPGMRDLYETTTGHMLTKLNKLIDDKVSADPKYTDTRPALYAVTGELERDGAILKAGRNIIKKPLTAMLFGSAMVGVVRSMFGVFVEDIYSNFERISKLGEEEQEAARQEFLGHLNTLLKAGGYSKTINLSVAQMLKLNIARTPGLMEALENAFNNTYGEAVKHTLEGDFAAFLARRTTINKTAQATFEMYDAAYQAIKDNYIQELIAAGDVAFAQGKTQKIERHDLTRAQRKELDTRVKAINPIVHTYMSKESNDLDSGIHMSSSDRKLSTEASYRSQVGFGSPMEDRGYMNLTTAAYKRLMSSPGVAMVPMMIHSLDSAISHMALMGMQVLNVHDAHGSGLRYILRTAQRLNRMTWKATLNYSPTSEIKDAWKRNLEGMVALLDSEKNKDQIIQNLIGSLDTIAESNKLPGEYKKTKLPLSHILTHMTREIYRNAYEADKTKYDAMAEMHYVDQYALQNGQYDVSDSDRADAKARSEALVNEVPAEVFALIDKLNTALGLVKEVQTPATSIWGQLGQSKVVSDPVLVEFFKKNPETTVARAIQGLERKLQGEGQTKAFNRALLDMLKTTVSSSMKIKYVSSDTLESEVLEKVPNARGWFVHKQGKDEIYILSDEFINSGLTTETLLHELTHGALASVIYAEQAMLKKDSTYQSHALDLIDELDALAIEASSYVYANGLKEYTAAVSNIHEFVTWGMTNPGFRRDVLNKITFKSTNWSNQLVSGMKAFVRNIVGILFKDASARRTEIAENGMTVLFANVAGLFNVAQQTMPDSDQTMTHAMASVSVRDYTTVELYESLDTGKLTGGFNAHLKSLLSSIVEKIHGPYGSFMEARMKQTALDPLSIVTNAMVDGAAPLFKELRTAGIAMDDQAAFVGDQVYATMVAAMRDNEGHSTVAARELAKLYKEAHDVIKVEDFVDGDWSLASQESKDQATETYNAIFKLEKVSGDRTDHLARFAALGLTHPQFHKLLRFDTKEKDLSLKAGTFVERLQKLFARMLDWVNNLVTHTYAGQKADTKLLTLVDQLIQIEVKKVSRLKKKASGKDYFDIADDIAKDALGKVVSTVGDLANSNFIRNNRFKAIAGVGALARVVANDQVDLFLKTLMEYRNANWKQNLGLTAGLLNSVIGPKKVIEQLLRGSKHIESLRNTVITQTRSAVLNAYANNGDDLTDQSNAAITRVLLRTGAFVLLNHMNMSGLHEVVSSRAARLKTIKTFEDQLNAFGNFKKDFIYQSKALAFHMITSKATSEFVALNAHNIARLLGTNNPVAIAEADAVKAEPIIDALISMYALDYSDQNHLNAVAGVLATENARTDGNGVEFSLVLQRKADEQARETLFVDAGALMIKGFMPEVFNPNTAVESANALEGTHLESLGYTKGPALPKDPKDPGKEVRHLYVLRDGGLMPYLSGIMSHTGMRHKGTLHEHGYVDPTTFTGQSNIQVQQKLTAAKQAAVRQAIDSNAHFDPTKSRKQYMVPVINAQGEVANWRYMMQETTKDTLLERDNRSEQLLGVLAGSVFDKESTNTQNRKAIEALHAEFKESFALRADSFVEIGPKAPDPVNQEIYRLLPEVTKQAIKEIWGKESMQVPVEMLDIVFGYRKNTIASIFDKVTANRKKKLTNPAIDEFDGVSAVEHAIVFGVEWALRNYARVHLHKSWDEADVYAKRGAVVVRRAERAWQEAVKVTKDVIVVRTGIVMAGNIMSNFSLLKLQGVSWADIIHSHRVGMRGAQSYNEDSKRLFHLRTQLEAKYQHIDKAAVQREILQLEDAIARNPVKELIDAGLMPTIVEDMETATDPYSYKTALMKQVEKHTAKVNPTVLSVAKTVVVAQDTQLYKLFSEVTQLSDFVARYTLYQHLVSRKHNPLDTQEAIHESSEAFINYDLAMHRTMQYLDDMGLTMFTKYFLGIQRVLAKNLKEHPLRVLTTLALDKYFNATSLVTESSAIFHIGHDPFRTGAMQLPTAIMKVAPIQATMSLIQ